MKRWIMAGVMVVAMAIIALPARAGNIALTGHDDDYHCYYGDPNACSALGSLVSFARNGSGLKVLTFDAGVELTNDLTSLGISFTNVDPTSGASVTASLFNNSLYSAFIVASDGSCGGCDNSPGGEANIAAQNAAIDSFLNAGGGIVGLAGASSGGYYGFVPQTATSVGGAPSSGYSQTSVGATFSIPAVNGDATHNLFANPGTSGESSFYQIAEVNSVGNGVILPPAATTLICNACTVSGGVITGGGGGGGSVVPEPSSLILLGSGCLGIAGAFRRKLFPNR
jgi:PEP-CTERM motif